MSGKVPPIKVVGIAMSRNDTAKRVKRRRPPEADAHG
jgi:hypothetical protein